MQHNKTLKTIALDLPLSKYEEDFNTNFMCTFLRSLGHNSTIEETRITNSLIKITHNNKLSGIKIVTLLADILPQNKTLRRLYLPYMHCDKNFEQLLMRSLQNNTTLQVLTLYKGFRKPPPEELRLWQ